MIVDKLRLIGDADQLELNRAVTDRNLEAIMASGDHQDRMVRRCAEQGPAMTIIQGPPQQRPARREVNK